MGTVYARALQGGYHRRRYRATLGGYTPVRGVSSRLPPGGPSYEVSTYRDEHGDDFEGHQPHEGYEEFEEFDSPLEGTDEVVYRPGGSPGSLVGTTGWVSGWGSVSDGLAGLVSFRRTRGLPLGGYHLAWPESSVAGASLRWAPAGVDHPGYRSALLGGYEHPRRGRLLARSTRVSRRTKLSEFVLSPRGAPSTPYHRFDPAGGDLLWGSGVDFLFDELTQTGWTVTDEGLLGDPTDDLDSIEVGSPPAGSGYRDGPLGGYLRGLHRPARAGRAGRPGWSPPRGLNGWRYLLGENLARPATGVEDDPERYLTEGLGRRYLEGYLLDRLEVELSFFFERDSEDYLQEGFPFEELHEEIPRTRSVEYPPWVVDLAVEGASAGSRGLAAQVGRLSDYHAGGPELEEPVARVGRQQLRGHYLRWLRRPPPKWSRETPRTPRGVLHSPGDEDDVSSTRVTREGSPHTGYSGALIRAELDTLVGAAHGVLEDDEFGQESLRLWALTEVYYGDYPVGSSLYF